MANEDVQAAALLGCGTTEEQVEAVATALQAARLEARTEGWLAAVAALRAHVQLLDTGGWGVLAGGFEAAAAHLESLSGPPSLLPASPNTGSNDTGDTDG